jgi:hypothetical protein
MKKIMIALALIGISFSSAQAQTKGTKQTCQCASIAKKASASKVAHVHHHTASTSGDTYQVCVQKGGHYECCMHHKKVVKVATK